MSEFAYSLHLFGAIVNEGVNQLRSAQLSGAVLGTGESATTLLIAAENVDAFLAGAQHPVLVYSYPADYGLWLWFYDKENLIAKIEYAWLEEGMEETPQITPNVGKVLLQHGLLTSEQSTVLQERVNAMAEAVAEQRWDKIFSGADEIGKALGLYAFRRLNEHDLTHNRKELQERYPEMVIVGSR